MSHPLNSLSIARARIVKRIEELAAVDYGQGDLLIESKKLGVKVLRQPCCSIIGFDLNMISLVILELTTLCFPDARSRNVVAVTQIPNLPPKCLPTVWSIVRQ